MTVRKAPHAHCTGEFIGGVCSVCREMMWSEYQVDGLLPSEDTDRVGVSRRTGVVRIFESVAAPGSAISSARLRIIASALAPASAVEGANMAQELLEIRAERTNDAHQAQLEQAVASVARSLRTQFLQKVYSVWLKAESAARNPGDASDDDELERFFDDVARNAIGGIGWLIAREVMR